MTQPIASSGLAAAVLLLAWVALPVTLPAPDAQAASAACSILSGATASLSAASLERCRASQPRDTHLLVTLGDAFRRIGDDGRAEDVYRELLRIDAGYAEVHIRMARLLLDSRRFEAAETELRAALQIQPNRRELQNLLAVAQAGSVVARR